MDAERTTGAEGRRRRAAALAALVVLGSVAPLTMPATPAVGEQARSDEFDDVADDHPFHDEIGWLAAEGYASGYADGRFHPTAPVSRQALVQMLWRMSGEPAGPFPDVPFDDVAHDHPFVTAIEWAYSMGIIGGYDDGTFRPGAPVSRQAFAALLHRLSGITSDFAWPYFTDLPWGHPHMDHIRWWVATGQARGYPDYTFRPARAVTRQAAAAFLSRFFASMGGVTWPYEAHSHNCTEPVTAEQQAAADDLLDATADSIAANWPTRADAEADGYHQVGPTLGGFGAHLVKVEHRLDGVLLDPTKPEVLMVDDGPDGMVRGVMFLMEQVGDEGPQVGGCLTQWHAHENVCFTGHFLEGGDFAGLATWSPCPEGSMVRLTPQMLHVFVDGRPNPFEGIET
jgi:hypothetical protein